MFTRQHCIKLAAVLSYTRPSQPANKSREYYVARHQQWRSVLDSLADMLAMDNPDFDRERFTEATENRDYWKVRL